MASVLFRRFALTTATSFSKLNTVQVQVKKPSLVGTTVTRLLSSGKINFDELVNVQPVVVFMKGTPEAPRCGFSNAVCQILKFHGIDNFQSYDVLSDEDIRAGVKEYTNWPTIPQVFFKGDFIGGCDVLLDMHKNGELIDELQKIGIRSRLLDETPEDDKQS